jgi:hypothetical protein
VKRSNHKDCHEGDSLIAGPQLPGGFHPFVRHRADHRVQAGIMRPVKDGEPLPEGAIFLERRGDSDLYDVKEVFPSSEEKTGGPAKVNSPAFRDGWSRVFGDVETPEA